MNPSPRQRRAGRAWQIVTWSGLATAAILTLASLRWHLDPRSWTPLDFGLTAVGLGGLLIVFPREIEALWKERMQAAVYRSGLPSRWIGFCTLLAGGWTVVHHLMR